jgi:hydrogenase maturation protease
VRGDVLIIGYGNVLRSDDGVGWHVADRIASDPRFADVTVLRQHQLAPENALDLSEARLALLIDAGHGPAAGSFVVAPVDRSDEDVRTLSHHLGPATLVALAEELYGTAPEVLTVTVGAADLGTGERLSPAVHAALPAVVDAVAAILTDRRTAAALEADRRSAVGAGRA